MFESCRRNYLEEVIQSLPFLYLYTLSLYFLQFSPILPQFSSDIHLIFTIFHFLTLNICVYRIKPLLLHNNILMCNRLIKGKASLCQYPKQDKNL